MNIEDSKKKGARITIIVVIIVVLLLLIGGTVAYFIWQGSSYTDVSLKAQGVVVELSDGADIVGANLMPTNSYLSKDAVNKSIRIRLKNVPKDDVVVSFNLLVNSIDSGLKDSSFKYTLVKDGTIVKEGNFASANNGDSILLTTVKSSDGTLSTATSNYNLYIWIDGESGNNPSSMMNKGFDFSVIITGSNSSLQYITATKLIEGLDDGTTGDSGSGVYKVSHAAIASSSSATGEAIEETVDYRFYGASPNNFVCLDASSDGSCADRSLFRIIGSMRDDIDGVRKIKVIKASNLQDDTGVVGWSFDYGPTTYSDGNHHSNIWARTTSGNYSDSLTSGSELMRLFNSGAWWNSTVGVYYNNSTTGTNIDFSNSGLTEKARGFISKSRYYLGGYNNNTPSTDIMYGYERGTGRFNTSEQALYWDGYVGLMYPSDYGYAAGENCYKNTTLYAYEEACMNSDWLWPQNVNHEWQITPDSSKATTEFNINMKGFVNRNGYGLNSNTNIARPVFYLSGETAIISGNGTKEAPYVVSK